MLLNTVMIVSPHTSQNAFSALKMASAALFRAFHRTSHRVLMPSHILAKDSLNCSPFSAHHADRAPKMACAAPLMASHTFSRNDLMVFHAFNMVCLALSAPMPALSNKAPMTLLSPRMNAMKS